MIREANAYSVLAPTQHEFIIDDSFQMPVPAPPKLRVPVTAFYEAEDESFVTDTQAARWEDVTEGPFELVPVYGPHLFLKPEHNETELCDMILERIHWLLEEALEDEKEPVDST